MQHTQILRPDHELEFIGGSICLDFTNTLGGSRDHPTHEHIGDYAELVAFARAAGVLRVEQARRLLAAAERDPGAATEIYRRSIALREAISRAFGDIAAARAPQPKDLELISAEAASAAAHARLVRAATGFAWSWPEDDHDLSRPLWDVARSAADLLMNDGERARVRECASDTCTWLFIDQSRNHSRRWCDMNDCGNRAKQRRFQRRQDRVVRKAR